MPSPPLHFLLFPVGSHGDVHPFIGLGRELARRGHEVTVFVNSHFRETVSRAGLGYVEVGKEEDFSDALEHPDLWKAGPASMRLMAKFVTPMARTQYDLILEHHEPGRTIVVAGALAFGARIAQDKHDIPTASIQLAPSCFRSNYETPVFQGVPRSVVLAPWMPHWLKDVQWRLIDFVLDRYFGPPLNALRKELGLQPVRRVIASWWLSPRLTLGLFPEWFAGSQPDWPEFVKLTGFPVYDEADVIDLPGEAERFFDGSSPEARPLVFTHGSANFQAKAFFQTGIETARILSRPAALLTRERAQLPRTLPQGCQHFEFLPFSAILPRAGAIIHHGGVGTTAQAMRAGCPQVIVPMAFDQLDNAERVRALGIGDYRLPEKLDPRDLAKVLRSLSGDPGIKERCRSVAERFENVNPIGQSCDLLESLGI